ncbi:hypothetical protein CRE_19830 [Caenorhabditis remanei]|uniref:G-protein coupled receptors family 1 profile domain-containing protein n=1 Tax=Caenorhabditis remanei TaxID=31234 RepID=E3MTJ7_CAERE|nr:hypothetical protein CRE_19830 [Caenorhabditis remanei]
MNQSNLTTVFKVLYISQYPSLFISIFGMVTNFFHFFIVKKTMKTNPIFTFLMVICVFDCIYITTTATTELVNIINYIDHKCIGFINNADMYVRAIVWYVNQYGMATGSWITIFMGFIQIVAIKNPQKTIWNQKRSTKISLVTIVVFFVFFFIEAIFQLIFFSQLPFPPCLDRSLFYAQNFLLARLEIMDWITVGVIVTEILDLLMINNIKIVPFIVLFIWLRIIRKKAIEFDKLENSKIINSLLWASLLYYLSPLVMAIPVFTFITYLTGSVEYSNEDQMLVLQLSKVVNTFIVSIRPLLIMSKSADYQTALNSFFSLFSGQVGFFSVYHFEMFGVSDSSSEKQINYDFKNCEGIK